MLAKIIATGETRDDARRKLARALKDVCTLGLATNREFLVRLLEDEAVSSGAAATDFIEANSERVCAKPPTPSAEDAAVAGSMLLDVPIGRLLTGWNSRGAASFPVNFSTPHGDFVEARISVDGTKVTATRGDESAVIDILSAGSGELRYISGGQRKSAFFSRRYLTLDMKVDGRDLQLLDFTYAPATDEAVGADIVKAPMAGIVTGVAVKAGDRVEKGQTVATIEAMKMEHKLTAPRAGVVAEVLAQKGHQAAIRTVLVRLENAS
jgi:geranyl-CoA carboxylase alpha subunit